jgi:hypothetical protein
LAFRMLKSTKAGRAVCARARHWSCTVLFERPLDIAHAMRRKKSGVANPAAAEALVVFNWRGWRVGGRRFRAVGARL